MSASGALANLDENGIVRVGTRVGPGDILVGKIAPKSKSELTPEEKLLHAIFGRAGEDVKNDSLEMPAGEEGVVIGAQRFSRRMHMTDEQKKQLKKDIDKYEKDMNLRAIEIFKQMIAEINEVTGTPMVDPGTTQKVGQSENPDVILEQIESFSTDWIKGGKEAKEQAVNTYSPLLAARAGGAEGKSSPYGAHEARRRAAVAACWKWSRSMLRPSGSFRSATRWPAVTATRALSPASCRKKTCRSWKTERRSTSCSIRWACPAV